MRFQRLEAAEAVKILEHPHCSWREAPVMRNGKVLSQVEIPLGRSSAQWMSAHEIGVQREATRRKVNRGGVLQ